jgi:hypothetical protein
MAASDVHPDKTEIGSGVPCAIEFPSRRSRRAKISPAEAGLICAERNEDYCCGVAAGGAGVTGAGAGGAAGGVVRSMRG